MLVFLHESDLSRSAQLYTESTTRPYHIISYPDLPDLPDATETVAHGGQTGLKVFNKKLIVTPNLPASGDQVCSLKC